MFFQTTTTQLTRLACAAESVSPATPAGDSASRVKMLFLSMLRPLCLTCSASRWELHKKKSEPCDLSPRFPICSEFRRITIFVTEMFFVFCSFFFFDTHQATASSWYSLNICLKYILQTMKFTCIQSTIQWILVCSQGCALSTVMFQSQNLLAYLSPGTHHQLGHVSFFHACTQTAPDLKVCLCAWCHSAGMSSYPSCCFMTRCPHLTCFQDLSTVQRTYDNSSCLFPARMHATEWI